MRQNTALNKYHSSGSSVGRGDPASMAGWGTAAAAAAAAATTGVPLPLLPLLHYLWLWFAALCYLLISI